MSWRAGRVALAPLPLLVESDRGERDIDAELRVGVLDERREARLVLVLRRRRSGSMLKPPPSWPASVSSDVAFSMSWWYCGTSAS